MYLLSLHYIGWPHWFDGPFSCPVTPPVYWVSLVLQINTIWQTCRYQTPCILWYIANLNLWIQPWQREDIQLRKQVLQHVVSALYLGYNGWYHCPDRQYHLKVTAQSYGATHYHKPFHTVGPSLCHELNPTAYQLLRDDSLTLSFKMKQFSLFFLI